jgi:hypothetical protein
MVKRLAAFDFDGTLIDSPEKESGKLAWAEKMGKPYPFLGWWGRPESLDLRIFDIKPFPSVLSQLKKEKLTPDTYVIILTSRMEKLRPEVQAILDANKIYVSKLDMKRSEKTKGEKILRYIQEFPDLEEINVYEDRDTDIASYEAIRSQIPEHITFNIYVANKGTLALLETKNKISNIIGEEIANILNEISHDDIQVVDKDWIKIGDELQGGKVIQKNELPYKLYHVTLYKTQVLSDGYLKPQKMGGGFGGGRIDGVSATADIENAITYYWGIVLGTMLSKTKNVKDLHEVLDWWIDKQEKRIGGDLSKLKDYFFDDFNRTYAVQQKYFMDTVNGSRKMMQMIASKTEPRLDDPIIVGGIERLSTIQLNDIVIFTIYRNEIWDETPIITGTDPKEIRILGNVIVNDYFQPR